MWWVHRWIVYLKTDQVGGLIGIPFLTTIGHSGSIPYFAGFSPTFACLKPLAGPSSCILQVTRSTTSFGQRTPIGNVANTVPLQAAGWGGFRYRIQKVDKVDPFPPVFDVETLNLGPTWVPGAWKISCSAQWRPQDLMYDALILAKQRVTNSAPD